MNKKHCSLLTISILFACNAHSAGFQVAEHSASGLGRAFSGEGAVADNASVLARNPAAMTLFKEAQFSGALSIVDPEVNVYDTLHKEQSDDVAPLQVFLRVITSAQSMTTGLGVSVCSPLTVLQQIIQMIFLRVIWLATPRYFLSISIQTLLTALTSLSVWVAVST